MLPSNVSEWESSDKPTGRQPRRRGRSHGRAVLGIFIGLVLLVGLAGLFVGRLASNRSTPTTANTGAAADASTQQAIKDVIQRTDQAQVEAVSNGDPNVMRATATDDFYQRQVQTNQDLANFGVSQIELLNMEWGPITVDGDTATATVYETWRTTFDDGTTDQSRDRNVYTLVRENGAWKVKADDHPDAQAQPNSPPAAP